MTSIQCMIVYEQPKGSIFLSLNSIGATICDFAGCIQPLARFLSTNAQSSSISLDVIEYIFCFGSLAPGIISISQPVNSPHPSRVYWQCSLSLFQLQVRDGSLTLSLLCFSWLLSSASAIQVCPNYQRGSIFFATLNLRPQPQSFAGLEWFLYDSSHLTPWAQSDRQSHSFDLPIWEKAKLPQSNPQLLYHQGDDQEDGTARVQQGH